MIEKRYTFKKKERLCSRQVIQQLFDDGRSFICYPFRVSFMPLPNNENTGARVLISVSKKRFKRANKRNWLKRRIREAYRLNKHFLLDQLEEKSQLIAISFVYLPQEILEYKRIEKGLKKALNEVISKIKSNEQH